jgi:hypothetical protein
MVLYYVEQNLEQPSATIGLQLEAMKRLPRLQVSLLNQVLGFGAVSYHSCSRSVQVVQVRQRGRLELFF